jgi:signal peptidase I
MKKLWSNKWVKFGVVAAIYVLLAVVWTGNLWMLLGLPVIWDIYISRWFYRNIWSKHLEHKKTHKGYKKAAEWVESIVFALVVVTLIRYFIFAMYVIPTPSMEKSLLVGDYLYVSKLSYGPVVPNTPISFPLVHNTMPLSTTRKSYIEWPRWKYHRLKGFGHVKRGDAVVFNVPAGDTVILEVPGTTYYDAVRAVGREMIHRDYTVVTRPVDKRENYIKRCVGLPGDVLEIVGSELRVNGEVFEPAAGQQFNYRIHTDGRQIAAQRFEEMGISHADLSQAYDIGSQSYTLPLTRENAERIAKMGNVLGVEQVAYDDSFGVFPNDTAYHWTPDDFGPLWVPARGETVELTAENMPLYRDIIGKYEGNKLEERDGQIFINGSVSTSYTFKMDYYFMMGDNRHNSLDSRYWGFVPEDHVVGKATFIWLSIDSEKGLPAGIRWGRMMRTVK